MIVGSFDVGAEVILDHDLSILLNKMDGLLIGVCCSTNATLSSELIEGVSGSYYDFDGSRGGTKGRVGPVRLAWPSEFIETASARTAKGSAKLRISFRRGTPRVTLLLEIPA